MRDPDDLRVIALVPVEKDDGWHVGLMVRRPPGQAHITDVHNKAMGSKQAAQFLALQLWPTMQRFFGMTGRKL